MKAGDEARPPRPGEELDADAVRRCLLERLPELDGDLRIDQFPAGHSNLTYLVTIGERELVLRRPPFGFEAIRSGHDMAREFAVLSALAEVAELAPRPIALWDADASPFGAPFYVMERVRGRIVRAPLPDELASSTETLRRAGHALVTTLAALHAVDASRGPLATLGKPEGYVRRQVDGWTARYARARTDDVPEMDRLAGWLDAHVPARTSAPSLLHNDFKFDNVVFAPDLAKPRVQAVLDWEMATVGEPLADLGTMLAYWIEPDDPDALVSSPFGLTAVRGNLTRADVVDAYARATNRDVDAVGFHYVLGTFKVAVIAQQIYARFAAGRTTDPRFAAMRHAVPALATAGCREIDEPKLPCS